MKKRIISIVFLLINCAGMEKGKEKIVALHKGSLAITNKKDSTESLPARINLVEASFANLMIGTLSSEKTCVRNSNFYKSCLELLDFKDTSHLTRTQAHKTHGKIIFALFEDILKLHLEENKVDTRIYEELYNKARNEKLSYYREYYFAQGTDYKTRAYTFYETGHTISRVFSKLLFWYKAKDLLQRSYSFFEKSKKTNNKQASQELDEVDNFEKEVTEKITNEIDFEQLEPLTHRASFNKTTAEQKFATILKEERKIIDQQRIVFSKKKIKAERAELKTYMENYIETLEQEVANLKTPEEIKELQEQIERYTLWTKKKKYTPLMAEKKHELELKKRKTNLLERLDNLESSHLEATRIFFTMFNINPDKSYIHEIENLMATAAIIGSKRIAYSPHSIIIKYDDISAIWEEIKKAHNLLNNPHESLLDNNGENL